MKAKPTKRAANITVGVIAGIAALGIDNTLEDRPRAFAQMVLWTVLLLAIAAIQLYQTLRRPIPLVIASVLIVIHVCILIRFRSLFPLSNTIIVLVGAGVESVIFGLLYVRIGQSLDPKGPFGMTDVERETRRLKKEQWRNLLGPK